MALFENFPYTNFHDLNLDWIIKEILEGRKKIDDFKTELDAMGVSIEEFRTYIEGIDQEIQDKIENEIPEAVAEAIQDPTFVQEVVYQVRKRRVVIISDSYGAGWTPDGDTTGFPSLVQQEMEIPNEDFFQFNKGGARFGIEEGSEYAFDTVLLNALPSITNKDTISDIIFAGGFNDHGADKNVITAGIARCRQLIRQNFNLNSVNVYLFAIGYHCINPEIREQLGRIYRECYARSGWAYSQLTKTICMEPYWASDGYHPLQICQNKIANAITSILNGGYNANIATAYDFSPIMNNGVQKGTLFTQPTDDSFISIVFATSTFICSFPTPITINRNSWTKIADITSPLPLSNTNDDTHRIEYTSPAILALANSTFIDGVFRFMLKQENRTTYGLYISLFALTPARDNYASYTNVSEVQISPNTLKMTIPFWF